MPLSLRHRLNSGPCLNGWIASHKWKSAIKVGSHVETVREIKERPMVIFAFFLIIAPFVFGFIRSRQASQGKADVRLAVVELAKRRFAEELLSIRSLKIVMDDENSTHANEFVERAAVGLMTEFNATGFRKALSREFALQAEPVATNATKDSLSDTDAVIRLSIDEFEPTSFSPATDEEECYLNYQASSSLKLEFKKPDVKPIELVSTINGSQLFARNEAPTEQEAVAQTMNAIGKRIHARLMKTLRQQ
ncbi:MAG: hypothetical protein CMJ78_09090 [Planctomycetaceae bacterium]|nr:hypothetical protein [Planctomycetaceae bacterium]